MSQMTGTLPVLPVPDVSAAITHYVEHLGFTEIMRFPAPDGTVVTGQVARAGCHVMFNLNPVDAEKRGGGVWLWIRDDEADLDAFYAQVKASGAAIKEELGDRFWGDRSFAVEDLNGVVLAFNKKLG